MHGDKCVIDSTGPKKTTAGNGETPDEETFRLRMLTVNCTSWHSMKQLVLKTEANVIFVQEHKMTDDELKEGTRWCEAQGWTSIWEPAFRKKGKTKGASGGVMIMARRGIGLTRRASNSVFPHRFILGRIEAPGYEPFLGSSVYFKDGIGFKGTNATIATEVIREFQRDKNGFGFIGADWNMSPELLRASKFLDRLDARIVAHKGSGGTCFVKGKESTIDYFVAVRGTDRWVERVSTLTGPDRHGIKTHKPVLAVCTP